MYISALRIFNVRSLQSAELALHSGFNVLLGDNGAGKTSVIEAIDYLSRGKSFRAQNTSEIIKRGESSLATSAVLHRLEGSEIRLSVKKLNNSTELAVNQNLVKRWSEITSHLPVVSIHPESYLLVMGGPGERRKYLDWGLFHVEPDYKDIWSSYTRAVKQRNVCLRNNELKQAQQWNATLAEYGARLNGYRNAHLQSLIPIIYKFVDQLQLPATVDLSYQQGWNKEFELLQALDQEFKQSKPPSTTGSGPHRADIDIRWKDKKFSQSSSRGQQKALTIAMHLAQSSYVQHKSNKKSIYLVDELPAELDQSTCDKILALFVELNSQIIITAVSDYYLRKQIDSDASWFHVEHGKVDLMV